MSGVDPDINLHDWRRRKKEEADRLAGKKPDPKDNSDIGYPIPGKRTPVRKFFESDSIKGDIKAMAAQLAKPKTAPRPVVTYQTRAVLQRPPTGPKPPRPNPTVHHDPTVSRGCLDAARDLLPAQISRPNGRSNGSEIGFDGEK
jgi:hypothetical protein